MVKSTKKDEEENEEDEVGEEEVSNIETEEVKEETNEPIQKEKKKRVKTQKQIEKARKSWRFDLRCGSHSRNREYQKGDIDVYALVALECQKVLFALPIGKKQITMQDEEIQATNSLQNVKDLFKELRCQQTP